MQEEIRADSAQLNRVHRLGIKVILGVTDCRRADDLRHDTELIGIRLHLSTDDDGCNSRPHRRVVGAATRDDFVIVRAESSVVAGIDSRDDIRDSTEPMNLIVPI
jgi:hypothetical protein